MVYGGIFWVLQFTKNSFTGKNESQRYTCGIVSVTFVSFNELCFRASKEKSQKVYLDRFQDMMDDRTLFTRQVLLKLRKTFVLVIIKYET